MEKENQKIITVSFVATGFVIAMVVNVLLESLAATFGTIARFYSEDIVRHGLPVLAGLLTFALLQFNGRVLAWADEVVVEVRKVVWPSRKDTTAMTVVTCIMLLVSGLILGFFDMLSKTMVNFILSV